MTGKNLLRNQILCTILLSVAVASAVIFSYQVQLLGWADNYLYDLNVVWRGPLATSERITLVLDGSIVAPHIILALELILLWTTSATRAPR